MKKNVPRPPPLSSFELGLDERIDLEKEYEDERWQLMMEDYLQEEQRTEELYQAHENQVADMTRCPDCFHWPIGTWGHMKNGKGINPWCNGMTVTGGKV